MDSCAVDTAQVGTSNLSTRLWVVPKFTFMDDNDLDFEVRTQIWMKTIDVQMHFNNLEMKVRNFGLTALGSLTAAAAFAYQQEERQVTIFLLVFSSIVWFAFYQMDRHWYHQLLLGAVASAAQLEKDIPDASLSTDISRHICSQNAPWTYRAFKALKKKLGSRIQPAKGEEQDLTETRMKLFYLTVGLPPLLAAAVVTACLP